MTTISLSKLIGLILLTSIFTLWNFKIVLQNQVLDNYQLTRTQTFEEDDLISSKRGFVAILYSGTGRSFSAVFQSHIINLFASSPYTVHLYFHLYKNEWRAGVKKGDDFYHSSYSVNSTLDYYESYINLDGQRVKIWSMVKGYIWESADNPEVAYVDQLNILKNISYFLVPIGSPRYQSSILLSMLHTTKGSNSLKRTYETIHSMKYVWAFRVRCDMLLRTNVWEDIFSIEPFNAENKQHQQALQYYLTLKNEVTNKRWNTNRSKNQQILSHYDSYDSNDLEQNKNQTYLPIFYFEEFVFAARLNPSSALYTPACDENGFVNDQFGFSSSLIMDHYEARASVNDIKNMLQDEKKFNFTWGSESSLEFRLKQASIRVKTVEVCWNIVRVKPSNPRSERNAFLSSSNHEYCHFADYHGRTCCDKSCEYWLSKWNTMHIYINQFFSNNSPFFEPPLNISEVSKKQIERLQLQQNDLKNYRRHNARQDFYDLEDYYTKLDGIYETKLRERTFNRARQSHRKETSLSSNHYFLHMYGRILNRIACFNGDYANGHIEQTVKTLNLINPYHDKYFSFIQTTSSELKRCLFRKHQTCQQNNEPY